MNLPKINRPPSLALMAQIALAILGVGVLFSAGYGFGISSAAEPKTEIRTITRTVPTACLHAITAAETERAHTATATEHDTLADERAAERYDAQLTRDDDTIADAADALDAELLLVQQARLDAGTAAAAFDEAAAECREVAK